MTLTPMKAIRHKCVECCGGQFNEVKQCPVVKCPLYPYRMGHRPSTAGESSNRQETGLEVI